MFTPVPASLRKLVFPQQRWVLGKFWREESECWMSDVERTETCVMSALDRHATELTVMDVYDIAAALGQEFERIIDRFGCESVVGVLPKVVRVLELLETLVSRGAAGQEAEELRGELDRLRQERSDRYKQERKHQKVPVTLSVYLSVYLSVCLPVCLSVCLCPLSLCPRVLWPKYLPSKVHNDTSFDIFTSLFSVQQWKRGKGDPFF